MARMIQLRNVPDTLHRILKIRAAMAGTSLSDYVLMELRQICERPTLIELRERLHRRAPVRLPLSAAQVIRSQREAPPEAQSLKPEA
jgi:plasmid stability protein